MAQLQIGLDDMADKLTFDVLKNLMQKAYEQGVEDGRTRFNLPLLLKKEHIAQQMSIKINTVPKIVAMPGFPVSKLVQGRYPRDGFIQFVKDNQERVGAILRRA